MEPRASFRALARLDAVVNRVFTSRANPLYHSGALTAALLGVLLVTGIYLLLFYRIGAPYASVAAITDQAWAGRWIRGLHRFASDAAVVAAVVHAFRLYAQRRTWGPRALAWISGLVLLAVIFISGWTGFLLVWDNHAQVLAVEGARLMDALPLFAEPIGRSFVGERALPDGFFFLNLFAHIALPTGMALILWIHVARVARPVLLPARPVLLWSLAGLLLLSVLWPLGMAPESDPPRPPADVPMDWFFAFWLPLSRALPAWVAWVVGLAGAALLTAVPWLTRPRSEELPAPATVNERACVGCEQCVHDCPYDAIDMVARAAGEDGEDEGGRRSEMVARVEAALCTSCGICVGSCPTMAIGPMAVTGRDQLAEVRAFLAQHEPGERDVVVVGCAWSGARAEAERTGASYLPVPCVGAMHSSTVEFLLRGGAGGVLVVGCPEHDGRTREGLTWAEERLFKGRKADLKERVDRRRVRLVQAALGEGAVFHDAAQAFAEEIDALASIPEEERVDVVELCRMVAPAGVGAGDSGGEA